MPDPTVPASAPAPKKRGLFGFLFKSALGCTAFGIGALVALILLLPTLSSSAVRSTAENAFDERFEGRLEVAETKLAWFSPNVIRGAIVRDPDGREVARASVVAPSLRELLGGIGSGKLGRIEIEVDADLVADDSGVTNLERALHPRSGANDDFDVDASRERENFAERFARLDADVVVHSKRISWSDAQTRRAGAPFELRDLEIELHAKPGAALQLSTKGRIVAVEAGKLAITAKIGGPIDPDAPWPFGPIDADVRIEGFSSAMVDGLASLRGALVEVLGPRFDIIANVRGASPSSGDLSVEMNAPRASIAIEGRFDGGALRSGERPFLVASLPAPRGLVSRFLATEAGSGLRIELGESSEPWSARISKLVAPIPPLTARTFAAVAPHLNELELDLELTLPSTVTLAHPSLASIGGVSFSHAQARVQAAHGGALGADLTVRAFGAQENDVKVSFQAGDAWTALSAGRIPLVDLDASIRGLPLARFDPLVAPRSLSNLVGERADIIVEAHGASATSGSVRALVTSSNVALEATAKISGGVVTIASEDRVHFEMRDPRTALAAELAAVLPEGTRIDLGEGALVVDLTEATIRLPAANQPFDPLASVTGRLATKLPSFGVERDGRRLARVGDVELSAEIANGTVVARVRAALDSGAPGSIALDATVPGLAGIRAGGLKAIDGADVRLDVRKLSTAMVAALAEPLKDLEGIFGPELSATVQIQDASMTKGALRASVESANTNTRFVARLENGRLRANGEDGVSITARIPAASADLLLANSLPASTKIVWRDGRADVAFQMREIDVPLPDFGSAQSLDIAALLENASASLRLVFPGASLENEATRAAKTDVGVRDLVATAALAPKTPFSANIAAKLVAGAEGSLRATTTIENPFASLRDPKAALPPIDARIDIEGLDPALVDALAGQNDLFASLCGGPLSVAVEARDASLSGGSGTLTLTAPALQVKFAARVENGVLTCSNEEGLDVASVPSPAFFMSQIQPRLPEGTTLTFEAPGTRASVRIRDVRFTIDGDEPLLARLAKSSARVDASLPALRYGDAATRQADRPIVVRETKLVARVDPAQPPTLRLDSVIEDATPGVIGVDLTALDALSKLGEPMGLDTFRARASVKASNVPTAIVDLVAGQDGLLVEALGARCEVALDAPDLSLERGAFTAELRSDLHHAKARGRLEKRVLKIETVDGVLAEIGLGPIGSKRIVGSLVPILVDVEKEPGAEPARFAIDSLNMPLDGDLSKLDAIVRVDLGEISYGLLPGLSGFLGSLAPMKSTRLKAITVPIEKGIARYDRLPITISGREVPFRGSFNLVDRSFSLGADVPLALLGKKVNEKLDKAREYLPADMVVPLEIRGTWDKPRVSIAKSFLDDVVEAALKKGVGDLLEDLFKKKKKD